jgi:hypothetical protein
LKSCSALAHELGTQHQPLDRLVAAVDLFRIVGEADRLDDGAALEGLVRALDLEVLDECHRIAIGEDVAGGIANLGTTGSTGLGQLRSRHPFAAHLVIDILIVVGHAGLRRVVGRFPVTPSEVQDGMPCSGMSLRRVVRD